MPAWRILVGPVSIKEMIMKQAHFGKIRRLARQAGQGMTEYIIIVAVIAIGSIAVYSYFGDTLRNQTAAAATALSGKDGSGQTKAAKDAADKGNAQVEKSLSEFAAGKPSGGE
jgi:Flp pilus assembly pilin Flp